MGYDTNFIGKFKLNKTLDLKTYRQLEDIQDVRHEGATAIPNVGIWCKWAPTKDGDAIEWNGNEKFYDYVEWIKYLITAILAPKDYVLNGQVEWQGEDHDDRGLICIKDNVVSIKYAKIIWEDNP